MSSRFRLRLRLAVRNLVRQRRRTLLSGAAMIVAMALLVFSRALAEGGHEDWIEAGVRLGSGHVSLQAPQYRARKTIEYRLSAEDLGAVEAAISKPALNGRLVAAAPRLAVEGLASSASSALPVAVIGVDPERESNLSSLPGHLESGRYLEGDDRLQGYVGARLAERLGLETGDRFVLTAQDASGEIVGQMARVIGIFRTGLPEADEGLVQIPLETAREWLGVPGAVTSVDLLLDSSRSVRPVLRSLDASLAERSDAVRAIGWRESNPELDAAVRMDDWTDYVFHVVLFAIAGLTIINTILMSVMQRTREFGVMRALGLNRGEVGRLVFTEGMLLTLASGVVGMLIGLAVVWLFFRNGIDFSSMMSGEMTAAGTVIDPVIVPEFRLVQMAESLLFVFAVGTASSIYPAWRATRLDLAQAMKFAE
jgi:ABC-type lipoprotein release transport system permease subunit